jgi:hypothetical protein
MMLKDIHSQTGMSVDMILKSSLKRQSMDNITSVMLTFEGFEKKFQDYKEKFDKAKSSSSVIITNESNQRDDSQRKNKQTANGMTKKPLSLNKNMTSSIVSKDVKDENQSSPSSSTKILLNKNIIDSLMQESTLNDELESQQKKKLKEEVYNYGSKSSIPSTAKNSKNSKVIFPSK